MKSIRNLRTSYLLFSLAVIVFGVLLIVFPETYLSVVGIIAGAVILLAGIVNIVLYFKGLYFGIPSGFALTAAIAFMVIGFLLISNPFSGSSIITFMIGVFVTVEGIFRIQNAAEEKRAGLRRWWILLVFGIAGLVFGIMTILHPFDTAVIISRFAGVSLIIDGISDAIACIYVSKYIRKRENEPEKETIYYIGG